MEAHNVWEGPERRVGRRKRHIFRHPRGERERVCEDARAIEERLRLVNIQVAILRRQT